MIDPRYAWSPPCTRSLGDECVKFWKDAGGILFEWQELVIHNMLGLDADDMWASVDDGLDVARQNGKGVVLQAVELFVAFELGYPVVMHTAHEFATCQEHMYRLMGFIQDCDHLDAMVKGKGGYKTANGQESINLRSGARILFKARTKGGGRGYSGDLLVWDEAMYLPTSVIGAQMPMLRASKSQHGRKIIYAGSAVDQEEHPHGVPFARVRERGIAQDERVSWHEWSAPLDDLALFTEENLHDRAWWHLANPSMADGLIAEDTMADEIAGMPLRQAAVELFGIGDWPRTDGFDDTIISLEAWNALENPDSRLQEPYVLAFDVSPERRTSIALAGRNQDGDFHVELQESRDGTGWVVARIVEMVRKGDPAAVICDGTGPASSLIVALEQADVDVTTVSATEHGQACGTLVDMVADGTLAHLGSPELRDAVRGAKPRPLGDAWAWSRRSSSVDIAPLVAFTLALWGAATMEGEGELLMAYA